MTSVNLCTEQLSCCLHAEFMSKSLESSLFKYINSKFPIYNDSPKGLLQSHYVAACQRKMCVSVIVLWKQRQQVLGTRTFQPLQGLREPPVASERVWHLGATECYVHTGEFCSKKGGCLLYLNMHAPPTCISGLSGMSRPQSGLFLDGKQVIFIFIVQLLVFLLKWLCVYKEKMWLFLSGNKRTSK